MNGLHNREQIQILVIDDERATCGCIAAILRREGYTVHEANSVPDGITCLRERQIDAVLTDLRIGNDSGIDVVKLVQQTSPETESIVLTAFGTIESAVEAMHAGAFDYLTKPFGNDQLLVKVHKAIERKLMRQELIVLRQHVAMNYGFDNIVGISKAIAQVKETAVRIAPTDITVLITGASGTGKELFARAIHHHSHRRNGHFVAIDCGALPEGLLESELFGHVKGSFTSAWQNKKGLFEEGDGGTVFLDEVGNMPASLQVRLLRFLQDSEVRPIGAVVSRRVDIRVIAATNRDLKTLVADGSFREDLYYRLNVIPLTLPTLRERPEDIEMLTGYFLRRISSEMNGRTLQITRGAVEKLLRHSWAGNVRELENTLKRGAALCQQPEIGVDDIMFVSGDVAPEADEPVPTKVSLTLKEGLLDSGQRSLIVKTLSDNGWNFTKTATDLGIGRTTLWRKVKKYNLRQEPIEQQ